MAFNSSNLLACSLMVDSALCNDSLQLLPDPAASSAAALAAIRSLSALLSLEWAFSRLADLLDSSCSSSESLDCADEASDCAVESLVSAAASSPCVSRVQRE